MIIREMFFVFFFGQLIVTYKSIKHKKTSQTQRTNFKRKMKKIQFKLYFRHFVTNTVVKTHNLLPFIYLNLQKYQRQHRLTAIILFTHYQAITLEEVWLSKSHF